MLVLVYHSVSSQEDNKIFKGIHGESKEKFEEQLKFLLDNYIPISAADIKNRVLNGVKLPKNSFHLTFDDGLKQHYTNVFPLLKKYNIKGSFFVPTMPLIEKKATIVEKQKLLQYCLYKDYDIFLNDFYFLAKSIILNKNMFAQLEPSIKNIKNSNTYLNQFDFYSDKERFYRKIRNEYINKEDFSQIIETQFRKFYKHDSEFIQDYFMSLSDLKEMNDSHMTIGCHTHSHPLLNNISKEEMNMEIIKGFEMGATLKTLKPKLIHI